MFYLEWVYIYIYIFIDIDRYLVYIIKYFGIMKKIISYYIIYLIFI